MNSVVQQRIRQEAPRHEDPDCCHRPCGGAPPTISLAPHPGAAYLLDVFALHAAGRSRVFYETRPLAAVNDSIAEVLRGKAKARIVMTP
jgi:hypothetical protein